MPNSNCEMLFERIVYLRGLSNYHIAIQFTKFAIEIAEKDINYSIGSLEMKNFDWNNLDQIKFNINVFSSKEMKEQVYYLAYILGVVFLVLNSYHK